MGGLGNDLLPPAHDPATQSNFNDVRTTSLHLDWEVDWDAKIIQGSVAHRMKCLKAGTKSAIFDSSYLDITRVTGGKASKSKKTPVEHAELKYDIGTRHPVKGNKIEVFFDHDLKEDERVEVKFEYKTTPQCTALGWLAKEATGTGKYPFCYSQCQSIYARALLPCQDTPAVKLTYTSSVKSVLPLLMSALRVSPSQEAEVVIDGVTPTTYVYEQPVPIPSYLIALAGGELSYSSLGKRTGVWAEPTKLNAAVSEFSNYVEVFLKTAEELVAPYEWTRYDMLVLPSSFPYGGMENANLTTLTPALIVGDSSEVPVVAHELSHSWFGNSVSCANWNSFWLNEGWTTYNERLIAHQLEGEATRSFAFLTATKSLSDALNQYKDKPKYQRLHIPYGPNDDPDEAYSTVPYEKGASFLLYLERTVGGLDSWMPYVKAYFEKFRGKSITTDDWLAHFWTYWSQFPDKLKALKQVDFDAWIHGEGVYLPVKMEYDTTLADACYTLAEKWDKSRGDSSLHFSKYDLKDFSSTQIQFFLDTLCSYPPFSKAIIESITQTYGFNSSTNCEIRLRWYNLALAAGFYAPDAAKWVSTQGRMKYCRPIYKAINKVDPALAKKTFEETALTALHPIARAMVAKDLGVEAPK